MTIQSQILKEICNDLGLQQGLTESDESFKCRAVYSAIGRLVHSALWDEIEGVNKADRFTDTDRQDKDPSIIHFKTRVKKSLDAFIRIFPEISSFYDEDSKELADLIFNQFEATGQLYHLPYRVSPPIRTAANNNGITFVRGFSPFEKNICASGLGAYTKNDTVIDLTVEGMFNIPFEKPVKHWENTVRNAKFSPIVIDDQFEFLNLNVKKYERYWINKTDLENGCSLMRTKDINNRFYYLYKVENGDISASQLPDFLTENFEYLTLANGCLYSRNSLPKSTYKFDGSIIKLDIGYLFPPPLQNFIMLYSWSESIKNNTSERYRRIISSDIFPVIKKIAENCGFEFMEE